MSSVWANFLHQASYGGVEFDCVTTQDSISRAVARREYPRTNGANLQDMGAAPRVTRCQVIFFEREPIDGEDFFQSNKNHLERFDAFYKATQQGTPQDFVHPITGTYRALVEEFEFGASADEEDTIIADVTFVEDTTAPAVFEAGSSSPFDSGTASVQVQAEITEDLMEERGISHSFAADIGTIVDAWESNPLLTVREVNLQLQSIASTVDEVIIELEMTTDIRRYPLYRATQKLLWTVRQAAESFREQQPQLITITTTVNIPLRVLVTDYYGAAEAASRYREVMRLNDIDDPSLILAGTTLVVPARTTGRKPALRRTA